MAFQVTALLHPEFGEKLQCSSCAVRFYAMHKVPAVCPKCETVQKPIVRIFSTRRPAEQKPRFKFNSPQPAAAEEAEVEVNDEDVPDEQDDDDDEVDEVIEEVVPVGQNPEER